MDPTVLVPGGLALLLLAVMLYLLLRRNPLQPRLEDLLEERSRLTASLEHARQALQDEQERSRQALASEQQRAQQQGAEQKQWIAEQTLHFETRVLAAAVKLMEERGKALSELNQKDVNTVVAPFKEQLAEFRQRVDHIYAEDAKERGSLKAQIEQLTAMNLAMSTQADRLANALTVTSKSVGDWGETILGKILEDSGLRRGHEYDLQVAVTGINGERLIPDAIINLPESRQLVIDSKVSNKAWTEYCALADEAERELKLREHLASLRSHIKNLSAKAYSDVPELKTVDFVLMFVPVEAALLTAFMKDPTLYADAYRNRIVLVTPSTLMAVVKLVEGIWTFQKRKESADEIAEAGRRLYDKLSTFAQSFVSVGRAIQQSQAAFEQAEGQLAKGRGNAIRLAEQMKELGVTPSPGKQLPAALLQLSEPDEAKE
ncbi:MAG TPA: DNA recombination protein RmuC [Steroidobacteraceae bacterium]|nr:DNA recombination protein RmuC [Steroidobacteraceae bacterium]